MPIKPTLESDEKEIPKNVKWISLDPNHKNFFVGMDHKGNSVEFQKLRMITYWDKKIDELKSLRDVCEKNIVREKRNMAIPIRCIARDGIESIMLWIKRIINVENR